MERPHDYEITWDYEEDINISEKHKTLIENTTKTIIGSMLTKLNVFKKIEVYPIILDDDSLGVFCIGTSELPIIGIDMDNIIIGCIKYDVHILTAIRTTLYHELAHAIQEYKGKIFDEEEAEQFARDYEEFGYINKI